MPDNRIIIDVHTHIFNAWDIPLKGYLETRKEYGLIPMAWLSMALPVLVDAVRGDGPPVHSADPGKLHNNELARLAPPEYMRWAHVLAMSTDDIAAKMVQTYPDYSLFVPLMVDYEYWFAPSKMIPIDEQVETIHRQVILPHAGKIHPFVCFDPARQLAFDHRLPGPDGKTESIDPLALVKDAILNKGFIGVKLYNSIGYRPWNNAEVDKERESIGGLHKTREYKQLGGAQYDDALRRLYEFCIEKDAPITAHCQLPGVEAFKGASKIFGAAWLWWPVLLRYPNLRLNLAHFGWFQRKDEGYHGRNSWVKDICVHMSVREQQYRNFYVDVAHHDFEMPREKERFLRDYMDLMRDYPVVKKRLLFGTDWHVFVRRESHARVHLDFEDVLRRGGGLTREEVDAACGGNALRFLGMLPGNQNRARLAAFYQQHNITPPDWFVRAANEPVDV